MSIVHVNHVKENFRSRFASLIDMSDVKDETKREMMLWSRCLAAFAIASLAQLDDQTAAQAVVDEFNDDGIDAFYYDRANHIVHLVQAKFISNGQGSMDTGSMHKFVQGIKDVLEDKISQLGPKLRAKKSDIHDAIGDSNATFVFTVAYTGKPPLSPETKKPIDTLLGRLNDDAEDSFSLKVLNLKELHLIVQTGVLGAPVNLTVMLKEFGVMRSPYKAYYGQVDLADILPWKNHGNLLYHKNIRNFLGKNEVNDSIVATIKENPDKFFYFNNGITLLCSDLIKQPIGGSSTDVAVFDCKGASIINGAQTVGSIISAFSNSNEMPSGRVMLKLISLQGCPADFSEDVTRATNTQNKIEKRDFASLDALQYRLKTDLMLSYKKDYVFKPGEQPVNSESGCGIDEVTVALACAYSDISYTIYAKRNLSKLYDDITKPPYTALFNAALTVSKLWRAVEVLRAVDTALKPVQSAKEGKDRLIAVHGNRVILHLVFSVLGNSVFEENSSQSAMQRVPELTQKFVASVAREVATNHSSSYPGNIFKNTEKCRLICAAVGDTI
jgi:hypothetical protein